MLSRFAGIAAFGCSFAAFGGVVSAEPPPPNYSPVARGINKVCTPLEAGTPGEKTIYLTRLIDPFGTPGPWQRSTPADNERIQNTGGSPAADFAIVRQATALFTASVAHRTAGAETETDAWCFIGGKLARATFESIVGDQAGAWRHTEYFDRDTDAPTFDLVEMVTPPGGKPAPRPSPSAIAVKRYATPFDLPFYNAVAAATAGTLPAITAPKK